MFYRRRLPHWQPDGASLFLTWTLKGVLPRNRYPPPSLASHGKAFVWMDRYLDTTRRGPRWLLNVEVARVVAEAIFYGEQPLRQYELGAWVIMPNHVHLPLAPSVPAPVLMRRLKGYTARQANLLLHRTGEPFWQHESYDHWVRNAEEWRRIVRYIEQNPVRAGLVERPEQFPWSSAGWGKAQALAAEPRDNRGDQL